MSAETSDRSGSNTFHQRIGTLITPTDPYWVQTLEAIIHANQKVGDELVLLQPAATLEDLGAIPPDDLIDQILANDLDALITTLVSIPVLQALVEAGLPVIELAESEFRHPLLTAMSSLYEGGCMAGRFVAERLKGRGRAVCITAGLEHIVEKGSSRYQGFADALRDYPGIELVRVPAYWTYTPAYHALLNSLADCPRPIDAMFGVSDTVILAARDAGRKLGAIDEHTVLVGLNGDPLALAAVEEGDLAATIDTASEELGAEAATVVHLAAQGRPMPALIQQRFKLITRDNVAGIATRKLVAIADIPTHLVGYSRQQELDRRTQLEISFEITRQIAALLDSGHLVRVIGELVRAHFNYDWMRILRWSPIERKLVLYGGETSPAASLIPLEQDWLLQQVFISGQVAFIPDIHTSRRWRGGAEWEQVRARAVLPIQLGEQVIGVLDLQSARPMRQRSLEIVGLKLLANQIGIAIHNVDLFEETTAARQAAEHANELKTRLVANVGHEVRTPLNAILGFSQSIQKKLAAGETLQPAELLQDTQYIYRSGEHLLNMINDLLDLSRAEIGALSLYFEPLQPSAFLREVFDEFVKVEAGPAQVQWRLDVPAHLPLIRADHVRMRQVLINLLSNAAKYTPQGSITLGARVELPYLHLWVQDTGRGVPFELQGRIFEPFGIVGRKRRPEGIGLGLSITRHLVALHDGVITLESQMGAGSTFNVYLPLPGMTRQPERPDDRESAAQAETPVMLVVSTRPHIPAQILEMCNAQRLTPWLVSRRADIERALNGGKPAAVAWDLAHASSGEWNLIYRLSAQPDCAALPVVLYGDEGEGSPMSAGLTYVVFKTDNSNTLREWISEIGCDETASSALVVDDDPQARAYYRDLLTSQMPGRKVLLAENGQQAIDLLQTIVPALILLDLMMPVMDGFQVLERIRADVRTQRVPVVIISGKLLNYEDIQRLNYARTVFHTKGVFDADETLRLIRQFDNGGRLLPQPTSLLIKQVLAYLHQNYAQPINRSQVADAVGVSDNYLSQIFRQEITISPWDYLNRLRIQKARELLLHTQDSVTSIAIQVGFNDSAYFSRVFHKLTGRSPLEYRHNGS